MKKRQVVLMGLCAIALVIGLIALKRTREDRAQSPAGHQKPERQRPVAGRSAAPVRVQRSAPATSESSATSAERKGTPAGHQKKLDERLSQLTISPAVEAIIGLNVDKDDRDARRAGLKKLTHSPSHTLTNSYIWGLDLSGSLQGAGGIGGLLAVTRAGVTYFPCSDANGNITDYVTTNGTVVAHREFDAFGNTVTATGPLVHDLHHWFSSKYLDEETGLYYFGQRYYSPKLGRWPNRDPFGEMGAILLRRLAIRDRTRRPARPLDGTYTFCENAALGKHDALGLWVNDGCLPSEWTYIESLLSEVCGIIGRDSFSDCNRCSGHTKCLRSICASHSLTIECRRPSDSDYMPSCMGTCAFVSLWDLNRIVLCVGHFGRTGCTSATCILADEMSHAEPCEYDHVPPSPGAPISRPDRAQACCERERNRSQQQTVGL